MGSFLFFVLIVLMLSNSSDRRRSDLTKAIVFGCVALAILSAVFSSGIGGIAILGIILYFIMKGRENSRRYEGAQRRQSGTREQHGYTTNSASRENVNRKSSIVLTRSGKKRKKIIEDFNKKYELYLTDDQMDSIVSASFMSEVWKKEIYDMDKKYDDVHQWLVGSTASLRAYMLVFHVQDITSDIVMQESIVTNAFSQVMEYSDSLGAISQSKRVEMINNHFFTKFDELSFMVAYKFLESKGMHHELKREDIYRNETLDDVDDLLDKYAPKQQI